jgi:hypothetical protein
MKHAYFFTLVFSSFNATVLGWHATMSTGTWDDLSEIIEVLGILFTN